MGERTKRASRNAREHHPSTVLLIEHPVGKGPLADAVSQLCVGDPSRKVPIDNDEHVSPT